MIVPSKQPCLMRQTIILMSLAVLVSTLSATSLVKMTLFELVKNSGRIVVGRCLGNQENIMTLPNRAQLPYTSSFFEIQKTIKGTHTGVLEVKQFGHSSSGILGRVVGMPSYVAGREYVLLLTAESELGLTVPVGLSQGCFRVLPARSGSTRQVTNGLNNAGLFQNPDGSKANLSDALHTSGAMQISQKPGPIDYERFIGFLETLTHQ